MQKEKVEKKVENVITESPLLVKVGSREYKVAPPCAATLIMVSGRVPEAPWIETDGNIFDEVLATAKDSRVMFEMVAIMILGAKALKRGWKGRFLGRWMLRRMTDRLMYDCTVKEVHDLFVTLLSSMEIKDFFSISISLREISLIQKTREMDAAATAFGEQ